MLRWALLLAALLAFAGSLRVSRTVRMALPMSTVPRPYLRSVMPKVQLIVGSRSPSRQQILAREGFEFEVRAADIDEKALSRDLSPVELVTQLAVAKAVRLRSCMTIVPDDPHRVPVLLTADQVVVCGKFILEKPSTLDEARRFISMHSEEGSCTTVGSLALTDLVNGVRVIGTSQATVRFRRIIPEEAVDALLADEGALGCAGALMVEHPALQPFIRGIDGDADTAMGLSCDLLEELPSPAIVTHPCAMTI